MTNRLLAVQLPSAVFDELNEVSRAEGSGMEEFVRVTVEEKLADLRTVRYFHQRGAWRCEPGTGRPQRTHRTPPSTTTDGD